MDVFRFEADLAPQTLVESPDRPVALLGALRHHAAIEQPISGPTGRGNLKLGYRVSAKADGERLYEGRAKFTDEVLQPGRLYPFTITIPDPGANTAHAVLLLDFLYEKRFWFHTRGEPSITFDLTFRNDPRRILAAAADHPASAPRRYAKDDPELPLAAGAAIDTLCRRYGSRIAVDFAYSYILGRRADPDGLADRSCLLETMRLTASDMCSHMMASAEFQRRQIRSLGDPAALLSGWAA